MKVLILNEDPEYSRGTNLSLGFFLSKFKRQECLRSKHSHWTVAARTLRKKGPWDFLWLHCATPYVRREKRGMCTFSMPPLEVFL